MCIQITEKHAVCGCIYHIHAVDLCPKAGKEGHQVQKKDVQVGHVCLRHVKGNSKPDKIGSLTTNPTAKHLPYDQLAILPPKHPKTIASTELEKALPAKVSVNPYNEQPEKSSLREKESSSLELLGNQSSRARDPVAGQRALLLYLEHLEQKKNLSSESALLEQPKVAASEQSAKLLQSEPKDLSPVHESTNDEADDSSETENHKVSRVKIDIHIIPSILFGTIVITINLFALSTSLQVWLQVSGIHLLNCFGLSYFSWFFSSHLSIDFLWWPRYCRELFRPHLQKGFTRIEWTCSCGDTLFGDYIEKTPGSLRELAEKLKGRMIGGPTNGNGMSDCAEGFGGQACLGEPHVARSQSNSTTTLSSSSSISAQKAQKEHGPAISEATIDLTTKTSSHMKPRRWLELCIRSGRDTFKLGEIDLAGAQDDHTVFRKIREKYVQTRYTSRLYSWPLRIPSGGIFVELRKDKLISKDRIPTVSVMKRHTVPTSTEAVLYKYAFCPVPMDELPMDSRTFNHYFSKPHIADDLSVWTTRFPKLQDASLYYSTERLAKGWGIEITEELNWMLFFIVNIIALLLSGLVAGVSAYLMDDKSTGVAIGAWLSAVQGLAVAALFFYWSCN